MQLNVELSSTRSIAEVGKALEETSTYVTVEQRVQMVCKCLATECACRCVNVAYSMLVRVCNVLTTSLEPSWLRQTVAFDTR